MSNFDDFGVDLRSSYQTYLNKKSSNIVQSPSISPQCASTSSLPIDIENRHLQISNTKITQSLFNSLSNYETLKSTFVPPAPEQPSVSIPSPFPSLAESAPPSTQPAITIRLCYEAQRLTLPTIPSTITSLRSLVLSLLTSSKKIPLTQSDFLLHYYDQDGEAVLIDLDCDLQTAYHFTSIATPPILKLCIIIRRDIANEDSSLSLSVRRKWDYNDKRYLEESDEEEDYEKFYIKDFELEEAVLMREGYLYKRAGPYNKSYKNFVVCMYNWVDIAKGWTGKWENMPLMFNGEFGRMSIKHSLEKEKHTGKKDGDCWKEKMCRGGGSEILTKEESLSVIKSVARDDPNLTSAQILAQVKSAFPNAHLPERKHIHSIVSGMREEGMKNWSGMKIMDISGIKTLRNCDFGREVRFTLIDGKPKYFLHFYSDFQMQVAEEVRNDPNLHLFIDGTFKWWPKVYSQLLNVCVFHRGKKLYIPICHILMQTQKYEGYIHALNWIKETFKFNPKFVTVDFEVAAIRAIKELFPSSSLVPWFFHFVKWLWMNAQKCGLRKKKLVAETKQLIFSLKALAFRPKSKVYKRFQKIKELYENKGSHFKSFLEYFEITWMDGTFQIKDWNYYDKISDFDDLAITNNGLESFHQIIKSQLRRITPSFKGFTQVLSRAETLKKADYDEDRVNGDPQYNRWWPVTKILKELYVKQQANNCDLESSEKQNEDINPLFDDSVSDLSKLKEANHEEYLAQVKWLEREVDFLFEEFDDENQTLQQDSKLLKRHKTMMELKSSKTPLLNSSSKEFCEEYIKNKSSSALEKIKPLSKKVKETKNGNDKKIFFEDLDEELELIMNGDLKFQSYVNLDPNNQLKRIKGDS